jgi:thioredoxin reductase
MSAEKENKIILVGQGNVGKLAAHYLEEKGIDTILVDGGKIDRNSFEVNGVRYAPNKLEESNPKMSGKMASMLAMAEMFGAMDYGGRYERTLPKSVNIIKEYGLIQLKQSKLSKWEREQVVRIFEQNYKKLTT